MGYFSNDGEAATEDQLPECADCTNKVTCGDERTEFKNIKLCDVCYNRRIEELELEDETENLFI